MKRLMGSTGIKIKNKGKQICQINSARCFANKLFVQSICGRGLGNEEALKALVEVDEGLCGVYQAGATLYCCLNRAHT